ncbi:hypothetical protein HTZ85_03610 [Escherichia coli]|nr:hypothetical protein [Escherichia coli]
MARFGGSASGSISCIKADVVNYSPGPVITRFELNLALGVKAARISNLCHGTLPVHFRRWRCVSLKLFCANPM